MKPVLSSALALVQAGVAVYPASPEKRPLVRAWNASGAARTQERVEQYFASDFPDAQIGVACGPSKLVALDVDARNGGEESFRILCGDVGLEIFECAPVVLTPGGMHIWFKAPSSESKSMLLAPGLEFKGSKAGLMAPPSTRAEGSYRWRTFDGNAPDLSEMPPFPRVLRDRIVSVHRARTADTMHAHLSVRNAHGRIEEGGRNAYLFRVLGNLAKFGASRETLLETAASINANEFITPYDTEEIVDVVQWAMSRASGEIVDPTVWLNVWCQRIKDPDQLRLATVAATSAASIAGPYTPERSVLLNRTGFSKDRFYKVRDGLEALNCLRVFERVKAPSVYEFVMPTQDEAQGQ